MKLFVTTLPLLDDRGTSLRRPVAAGDASAAPVKAAALGAVCKDRRNARRTHLIGDVAGRGVAAALTGCSRCRSCRSCHKVCRCCRDRRRKRLRELIGDASGCVGVRCARNLRREARRRERNPQKIIRQRDRLPRRGCAGDRTDERFECRFKRGNFGLELLELCKERRRLRTCRLRARDAGSNRKERNGKQDRESPHTFTDHPPASSALAKSRLSGCLAEEPWSSHGTAHRSCRE